MGLFDFLKKKNKKETNENIEQEVNNIDEKQQELEHQQELEKQQELERQQELEKQQELERQQELEKQQELERQQELEKQQELERQQELEKQQELEHQQELEKQQELERQQELEKQQELEHQQELETQQELNGETEKKGFFKKVVAGLDKTRKSIMGGVENVLKSFVKIDDELFEELEETLIMADIGIETSTLIIELVKDRVKSERITDASEIKRIIKEEITKILVEDEAEFELKSPSIILIIGVNGVGKTTTIGKLTNNFKNQNKKVVLAAADTFRAAAIDQLEVWGTRSNVDVIKHQENSDPGAVVYDAIKASKARNADILICDTAGRLHNKKNLMEELKKIFKIINREHGDAQLEVFLVLDATTGQNALQQAKLFKEAANITGLVLTKLDGTAKGGIVIAIKNELKLPVRFIGVGEGINDLQPFNAQEFASALFGED